MKEFYDNLLEVYENNEFQAADATFVTTVQRPMKIISQEGVKQVSAVTSKERGELVTVVLAVIAGGNYVTLLFVLVSKANVFKWGL